MANVNAPLTAPTIPVEVMGVAECARVHLDSLVTTLLIHVLCVHQRARQPVVFLMGVEAPASVPLGAFVQTGLVLLTTFLGKAGRPRPSLDPVTPIGGMSRRWRVWPRLMTLHPCAWAGLCLG